MQLDEKVINEVSANSDQTNTPTEKDDSDTTVCKYALYQEFICTSHLYDIAQRQCCSLAFCLKHVAFELIGRLPVAYVNWGNSVLRVGYSFQAYSTETFNFAQVTTSCKQEQCCL